MAKNSKQSDETIDRSIEEQELLMKKLIDEMLIEFRNRYAPTSNPQGCELKTTTEITDMFGSVMQFNESLIAITLSQHGYRTKLIGAEFRWMLLPV